MQGNEKDIVVSEDDGIRPGVTPQALAALKPVFKKGGTTTAGNSSQVTLQTIVSSSLLELTKHLLGLLCFCPLAFVHNRCIELQYNILRQKRGVR